VTKKKRLITLTPGHSQGCHQLQEDRWRTHQVNCPNVRQRKGRHYRSNEYIDNKFLITPKPTLLPIIVLIRQKERSTKKSMKIKNKISKTKTKEVIFVDPLPLYNKKCNKRMKTR
jgi:hypothetical protein